MRLVLVGFMGSGKSTAARLIGERTGVDVVEMDDVVLQRSGRSSIAEIFREDGEAYFRGLERSVAEELACKQRAIVSAGGGVVTNQETMDAFRSAGFRVIYLSCDFEVSWARAGGDPSRPLFASKDKARALYDTRLPLYARYASVTIEAGDAEPLEICERILGSISR